MCSAHALFVFKVSRLNFLWSFLDCCARSPRSFENQRAVAKRRLGRRSSERRLLFKSKRLRSSRKLLKAVWAEFWKMMFFPGRNQFVRRTSSGHFHFFTRHTEGAVLFNFKWLRQQAQAYGKSATGAGRNIGPLSGGSARTRDQSDLRKRHWHFGI